MIVLAADHGGFHLKEEVKKHLEAKGVEFVDVGTFSTDSIDYPDVAKAGCEKITSGECEKGLFFCGTGVGISIAANKVKGIRGWWGRGEGGAEFTRLHNDSNVLCLGGRVVGAGVACELVDLFLETEFEGGRHANRVAKIMAIEEE